MIRAAAIAAGPDLASDNAPPTQPEILAAVERIVTSPQMRGAPCLVAFLRFIVERALAGRPWQIKSYTIAVEALGRAPSFDPQIDPIVRVEAGRLRSALAHYYGSVGRDDPVVLYLPRGGYVPVFRHAGARTALAGRHCTACASACTTCAVNSRRSRPRSRWRRC